MSKKYSYYVILFVAVCILVIPCQVSCLDDDSLDSYNLNSGDTFVWHVYDGSEINFLYKLKINGFNQNDGLQGEIEQYFIDPNQTQSYELCFQELIKNQTSLEKCSEQTTSKTRIIAQKKVECMQINQEESKIWIDLQTGVLLEQSSSQINIKLVSWKDSDLQQIAQNLEIQYYLKCGITLMIGITITSLFYLKSVYLDKKKQKKWIYPPNPLNLYQR
ncbi:hypothetical protein [Candidatus Lokiarchaeum ossiferum]|uniref:hypothetical protein n=1 Tax=Candidatus Lokiarchaeum ossiferum TaxID=2951803 RepID=UPI00352D664D